MTSFPALGRLLIIISGIIAVNFTIFNLDIRIRGSDK